MCFYLFDNDFIGNFTSRYLSIAITVKFPILANPMVDMNHAYLKLYGLFFFSRDSIYIYMYIKHESRM